MTPGERLRPGLDRRRTIAFVAGLVMSPDAAQATAAQDGRTLTMASPQPVRFVDAGLLRVAYLEWGPPGGAPVILLHGFPYDVHSYDVVAAKLAEAGMRVIAPWLRGYGPTRFRSAETPRVGQQAALGGDLLALMDALKIPRATLAGYDWGGRAACVVAALHSDRVSGLVSGGMGYNIQKSTQVLTPVAPEAEQRHWYWFYLNSERGAQALQSNRAGYCRHLWRTFSPTWDFDEETYGRTAVSFDNPDFVAVALHSYRYRIGGAPGDPSLEGVERKLSLEPRVSVPTIVLEGADDGVDPPADRGEVASHFTALRRQTVLKGVGHNIPQEQPDLFSDAVLELI